MYCPDELLQCTLYAVQGSFHLNLWLIYKTVTIYK